MDFSQLGAVLPHSELVINTVPHRVLEAEQLALLPKDTPVLDLASKPGGDDVAARKGREIVKGLKAFLTEHTLTAACCLLTAAALAYAAVVHERPAETKVQLSSQMAEESAADNAAPYTSAVQTTVSLCYDLNAAVAEDLMRVEGVGPVLAQRIIDGRLQRGGFVRRDELLEIDGIGEALAERIMSEFYIPGEQSPVTADVTETTMPAVTESQTTVMAGRYDLNQVSEEELLLIPGMTEQLAEGILELRTLIQYYTHLYEVLYVDGMSGVYVDDVLAEYLYVVPPETVSVHS